MWLEFRRVLFRSAIPISDKELEYKNKFGTDALETLFEKESIDIFDINRKSIVWLKVMLRIGSYDCNNQTNSYKF